MPRIEVFVTAQDIEQGGRRNTWTCPLCLALRRTTGVQWVVEECTAYPVTHRNAFIPLPPEAILFISEFDATGAGTPFSFELEVP